MIFIRSLLVLIFTLFASQDLNAMLFRQLLRNAGRELPILKHQSPIKPSSLNRTPRNWLLTAGATGGALATAYCLEDKTEAQQQAPELMSREALLHAIAHGQMGMVIAWLKDQNAGFVFEHAFLPSYQNDDQEKIIRLMINRADFTLYARKNPLFVRWALAIVASKGYQNCLQILLANETIANLIDHETAIILLICSVISTDLLTIQTVLNDKHIKQFLTIEDLKKGLELSLNQCIHHEIEMHLKS